MKFSPATPEDQKIDFMLNRPRPTTSLHEKHTARETSEGQPFERKTCTEENEYIRNTLRFARFN